MKADETRRDKGKKSSAINPQRFEVDGSRETPALRLPYVSARRFKTQSITSSRFPLKLKRKGIILITCDGDQVVSSSEASRKAKKVSLERLAHLRPHVQFRHIEYHFVAIGQRRKFELTRKKRGGPYFGLRPAETDSPLGHDVRSGIRTVCDILGGEVTYGPTTNLFHHIPVTATKTTTRLSKDVHPETKVEEKENEVGGDEDGDASAEEKGEDATGDDVGAEVKEKGGGGDDEKERGYTGDGDSDEREDVDDEKKDGHTHALMREYRDMFDKVYAMVVAEIENTMTDSTALQRWKRKNRNSMIGRIKRQLRKRRRGAVRERLRHPVDPNTSSHEQQPQKTAPPPPSSSSSSQQLHQPSTVPSSPSSSRSRHVHHSPDKEREQVLVMAGTNPNSVSGLECGRRDHQDDNGCPTVSNSIHSSASIDVLNRHGSYHTGWRKGLEHIPEALRRWDPGVDPFGVPYLSITRHSDQDRQRLWVRFGSRRGALSDRWQFGADPNIKSFYDLYLPATGCVIHVGQGWAQRVYNRYGIVNDVCASEMDRLINKCLLKAPWETDAELKLAKQTIRRRLETGGDDDEDAREYQKRARQIDTNWAAIAKAQNRLHEVTCILMAAFDIRILPWMETDKMLQGKGSGFQLSKANKRKLNFLAHGKFRQRLIHHCGDPNHSSNRIVWVTEEYTSKLCGRCGCYCGYLRGSRTFKCPNEQCGQHVDRDGNAAKNIWTWGLIEALQRMEDEKVTLNFPLSFLFCCFFFPFALSFLLFSILPFLPFRYVDVCILFVRLMSFSPFTRPCMHVIHKSSQLILFF